MELRKKGIELEDGWMQRFDVLKELGDCYASVGQYEQAQQCYHQAAELEPDAADPYVGSGVVFIQQGRTEDAKASFKIATRLEPGCSKAYAGLAILAQQESDFEEAFDMYLRSLELDPDNLTSLLGLFQASSQMGSFGKVIHYLNIYLDMHPDDKTVMHCLGTLYLKDQKPFEAKDMLHKLLQLDPSNNDALDLMEEAEHKIANIVDFV